MAIYQTMVRQGFRLLNRYNHLNAVLMDQVMVSGINFLTGLFQARYMGVQDFGKFSLAWMLILAVGSLQSAVIILPMMNIGSKQSEVDRSAYFGAVVLQQLLFSIVTSFLLFVVIWLSQYLLPQWQISELALPIAGVSFFSQGQEFLRRYFFTTGKPFEAFFNDIVSYISQIAMLAYFIWSQKIDTYQVLQIIGVTSLLAIIVGSFRVSEMTFSFSVFKTSIRRHLDFSSWLAASTLTQWVSSNYIVVTASTMLGPSAVGIIKASQSIMGLTHIIFNGLSNVIPIRGNQAFVRGGLSEMERYLLKMSLFSGFFIFLFALPSIFAPSLFLKLLYGKEFAQHSGVLFWFVFVYIFVFINQMLSFALRILEDTRPLFIGYLASALLGLVIAYPMVHFFKTEGVVMGLILLGAINTIILLYAYIKARLQVKRH